MKNLNYNLFANKVPRKIFEHKMDKQVRNAGCFTKRGFLTYMVQSALSGK
jgi:hypothetical protein